MTTSSGRKLSTGELKKLLGVLQAARCVRFQQGDLLIELAVPATGPALTLDGALAPATSFQELTGVNPNGSPTERAIVERCVELAQSLSEAFDDGADVGDG